MGESYCHGECQWKNNSCHERTMLEAFYGELAMRKRIMLRSVRLQPRLDKVDCINANMQKPIAEIRLSGCPLCLTGVRENVPLSISRCEKVENFTSKAKVDYSLKISRSKSVKWLSLASTLKKEN